MQVNVLVDRKLRSGLRVAWVRRLVGSVLRAQNASPRAEVGVVITDQETIRRLNKTYLGEDRVTDVLSFSMLEEAAPGSQTTAFVSPPDNLVHLGEVIISYPQAVIQSAGAGHSVKREVAVLLVHGVLHLLGLDHDTPERRRSMNRRQKELLGLFDNESKAPS